MSGAYKVTIIAFFVFFFSACSAVKDELEIFKDDVDLDVNDRTLDITPENAQPIVYGFIQSSLRAYLYLPLFNFLDSSDLPESSLLVDDEYLDDCQFGGRATYTASRPDGEEYRIGDRFSVHYDACEESEGVIYNGSIDLTYSQIDGLNESFGLNSTQRCLANIGETFDGEAYSVYENRDESGELFLVDDVKFVLEGAGLDIQYLRRDQNAPSNNEVIANRSVFGNSIVVVRALDVDDSRAGESEVRYKIKENTYPSLTGGDELFRLTGRTFSRVECQSYERYANLRASDLEATVDGVSFLMDGSAKIYQSSERLTQFSERAYGGNFSIEVTKGNDVRRYSFGENYSVAKGVDAQRNAYSYSVAGGMTFDGAGYAEFTPVAPAYSNSIDAPPLSGNVVILGVDLEAISLRFNSDEVTVAVDYNGDSTGDGASDVEATFDAYWYDILDQNFRIIE